MGDNEDTKIKPSPTNVPSGGTDKTVEVPRNVKPTAKPGGGTVKTYAEEIVPSSTYKKEGEPSDE